MRNRLTPCINFLFIFSTFFQVDELRGKLEEKNKMIEKKTQQALTATQDKNRIANEMNELRDQFDIKDRKLSVLQRKIENLEDLLKEKDGQVDAARSKLNAVQAQTFTSEGTLSNLEDALADKDKQMNQLREQRDRAEKDIKEEKELHERELTDYKMKIHSLESEVDKLQVRLDKAYAEKDKLEAKLENSQSELGKSKAELDKVHGDTSYRYNDYNDWRQKLKGAEMEVERLRQDNDRLHMELDRVSRRDMVVDPYGPPPGMDGCGPPGVGPRSRGRSPEHGGGAFSARSAIEIAELQDKLEKTNADLRRAQTELRLNQSDYDRSHVELEQMQEKVKTFIALFLRTVEMLTYFRQCFIYADRKVTGRDL